MFIQCFSAFGLMTHLLVSIFHLAFGMTHIIASILIAPKLLHVTIEDIQGDHSSATRPCSSFMTIAPFLEGHGSWPKLGNHFSIPLHF
jgi:hypothetical protein